ncbi:hypothetical protein VTO73DRAFT_15267 [Trametes versicolor]
MWSILSSQLQVNYTNDGGFVYRTCVTIPACHTDVGAGEAKAQCSTSVPSGCSTLKALQGLRTSAIAGSSLYISHDA